MAAPSSALCAVLSSSYIFKAHLGMVEKVKTKDERSERCLRTHWSAAAGQEQQEMAAHEESMHLLEEMTRFINGQCNPPQDSND